MNKSRNEIKYKFYVVSFSIVFLIIAIIFSALLYFNESKVTFYPIDSIKIKEENFDFKIENIELTDSYIDIKLWFVEEDTPQIIEEYIILQSINSRKSYKIPTEVVPKDDVNDALGLNVDYPRAGIHAKVSSKFLDVNDNYEIFILNKNDGKEEIVPLNIFTKGWHNDEEKSNSKI